MDEKTAASTRSTVHTTRVTTTTIHGAPPHRMRVLTTTGASERVALAAVYEQLRELEFAETTAEVGAQRAAAAADRVAGPSVAPPLVCPHRRHNLSHRRAEFLRFLRFLRCSKSNPRKLCGSTENIYRI